MKLFFALSLVGLLIISRPAQVPLTSTPSFEVADIHISPHRAVAFANGGVLRGDRYVWHQATMLDIISAAYSIDSSSIRGGPSWLAANRYEIIAKTMPGKPRSQLTLMLRNLLIDRFRLVSREEKRPIPAYVLNVSRKFGKPKMTRSSGLDQADCAPSNSPQANAVTIDLVCRNMTMELFAEILYRDAGGYLPSPVFNQTDLKGAWDFELKWTDKDHIVSEGANGISLFDAVDEQLGLRLNLGTAPGSVLVVDNIDETPTPNSPEIAKLLPPLPPATFDVAVIKPSKPDESTVADIAGGRVNVRGIIMRNLIAFAWNLNPNDHEAIANAPKWLDTDRFDLLAKASPEVVTVAPDPHATSIDLEDLREMQQNLLIDRFHIKAHMEDRPVWAYTLSAVKPKLHLANPSTRTGCKEGPGMDGKDPRIASPELDRLISCQNVTMAQLCDELQRIAPGSIYSSVKDDTGLSGSYDFTLSFTSANLNAPLPPAREPVNGSVLHPIDAITIFQAVSKELGLRLERQRRPAPVLVIDHIEEKPTEN